MEIAKAMGDIEEMKKVMTLSSKLLGSGDKHMYRDENDGDNDSSGEDNYHWDKSGEESDLGSYIYKLINRSSIV